MSEGHFSKRKLDELKNQGRIQRSRDFASFIALAGFLILMHFYSPWILSEVTRFLRESFSLSQVKELKPILAKSVRLFSIVIFPFGLLVFISAILSSFFQVGPSFTLSVLKPRWERIHPLFGLQRLWSLQRLSELFRLLIQMALLGITGFCVLRGFSEELSLNFIQDSRQGVSSYSSIAFKMASGIVGIVGLFGLIDLWLKKRELRRTIEVSPQEQKQEQRDQEGQSLAKRRRFQKRASFYQSPGSNET